MSGSKACWLITCFFPLVVFSQKPQEFVRLGQLALEQQRVDEAFAYFEKAYLLDTTNFDNTVFYAEAARDMKYYRLAAGLFEKLYEKDKGKVYTRGQYELACMQQMLGNYEDAYRNFIKYYRKQNKKDDYVKDCEQRLNSCEWAINYRPPRDTLAIRPLGAVVNSDESEIAPFYSASHFYFSSAREPAQTWEIYRGNWDHGEVRNANVYAALRDMQWNQANWCVDSTGTLAVFSRADDYGTTQLWKAGVKDGEMGAVSELTSLSEKGASNTMPHLARYLGREYLFFASDRAGGRGGMDIWYCELKEGVPGTPINAGPEVNTEGDELTPFFSESKLYYSSNRLPGFGGFDVFISAVNGDMNFSKPENMGVPINSPQNDLYAAFFPEIHTGFIASNREGSTGSEGYDTCCNDLYSFDWGVETPVDAAFATLEELNHYLPVTLYFHNDEPNPDTWDTLTNLAYSQAYVSLSQLLPVYQKENTKGLSGEQKEEAEIKVDEFFQLKVDKGVSDLSVFAGLALKELEAGKKLRLSVRGFASPRAESDYNLNLTKRRIASLINEMRILNDGKFIPYLDGTAKNGGRLEFVQLPFGEYKADKSVSDDLFNERQSIYSVGASLERKIEIQSVTYIPEEPRAILTMDQEVHDFGMVSRGKVVSHSFNVVNTGTLELVIDSIQSSCGCTVPELVKYVLAPGESTPLNVSFDTKGLNGTVTRTITIFITGEEPRVLTIEAEVR